MELKPNSAQFNSKFTFVLIVPYGIETRLQYNRSPVHIVLIVPYGIETFKTSVKNIINLKC